MTKKIINIGSSPGNLGDGDTLRDAFEKTQLNFDDIYSALPITDTTLEHDNASIEGTIASALLLTAAAGGGTVYLGPGTFICTSNTLNIEDHVRLIGAGRHATTIEVTGQQTGINLKGTASSVEALRVKMPEGTSGDGILISRGETHLRDLVFSGGSTTSWAIKADTVNIVYLSNIRMGGTGNALTGNGIIFQNTTGSTFNFGDSKFSKIDIRLANNNTTGIKIIAPDILNVRMNNILLSQIEVIGTGTSGACTGIHLHNASRITFIGVDLEQLDTGIIEEGVVGNCRNNVYVATFALGVTKGYTAIGNVINRLFMGCQNVSPIPAADGDVVVPESLWINEGKVRLKEDLGILQIDDGVPTNGIQITVKSNTPRIQSSSGGTRSLLTLGRPDSRGVQCEPGVVLPLQTAPLTDPIEDMLVQFDSGVVGIEAGLYQLRQGSWVFIN